MFQLHSCVSRNTWRVDEPVNITNLAKVRDPVKICDQTERLHTWSNGTVIKARLKSCRHNDMGLDDRFKKLLRYLMY